MNTLSAQEETHMDQPLGRRIAIRMLDLLRTHATPEEHAGWGNRAITGGFSLLRGKQDADLYGMVDAVYMLHTLGMLADRTDRGSRNQWSDAILACQDEHGWFSGRNLRGHSREHATAYAIGALRLLEIEPAEHYVGRLRPLEAIRPLLNNYLSFSHWFSRLGFNRWSDIRHKNVGWNHVWRGSHVAGGVAAAVHMTRDLIPQWWADEADVNRWFAWFFSWLEERVNPRTGFWQRAWWNLVYRRPTLIDLGGAVHFYWIYTACGRPIPYPQAVIKSTLSLQRESGLYRNQPFCIDLDGNYCVLRPYLQLGEAERELMGPQVTSAIAHNFAAVSRFLLEQDLKSAYANLHGPPGALVALVECTKLPAFPHRDLLVGWRHVLDTAPWM